MSSSAASDTDIRHFHHNYLLFLDFGVVLYYPNIRKIRRKEMDYITVKEASGLWKTDISTIGKLLRAGKIPGAAKMGGHWVIPRDTPKPVDGRTKAAKSGAGTTVFRFPLFVNFPEESFIPPLSPEEATLRQAQKHFYACEFQKAKVIFETLSENAGNIYVKICAQFFMCVLSLLYDPGIDRKHYYYSMTLQLSKDFPFCREMRLLLPLFDFFTGQFVNIPEKLRDESRYEYHPSALYLFAFLSVFNLLENGSDTDSLSWLDPYKTLCRIMESNGYYLEAQALHSALFVSYYALHDRESMRYHLAKTIDLAFRHDLIYAVADAEYYYSEEFRPMLQEYPDSFASQIRRSGKIIYENYVHFTKTADITMLYSKLSKSDYRFLIYALEGLTNKQVADICHVSERTVAKRYNDMYNKLGINSKQELLNEALVAFGKKRM